MTVPGPNLDVAKLASRAQSGRLAPDVRPPRRRIHWPRGGVISSVIVIFLIGAATYTLPILQDVHSAPAVWHIPRGQPSIAAGTEVPVFCLAPSRSAVRCGLAEVRANGDVGFIAYGSPPEPNSTIPVLADADIELLWALANPRARAQLQTSALALTREIALSMREATASNAWQQEYREQLGNLLDRATQQAWQADDTQQAFRALLRAADPVVRDSVAHDIGPAIAPYVSDAFWQVLKTYSGRVFSFITGDKPDLSSVGAALAAAMHDPRVQAALARVSPRIANLPQSEVVFERMAANAADALMKDPETGPLLTRIATDPRLGARLRQVRDDVGTFLHQFGRVLWGLGDSHSMNPLAGLSVRTTLLGLPQPMILLVDADDAATLARAMPGRSTLLVPRFPR